MKTLYEGILGDIDNTLNNTDVTLDNMYKLHWSYCLFEETIYGNVPGRIGGVMKKHFPKRPVPIESCMLRQPIQKLSKATKFVYNKPNVDYLSALILNTQLPKPIVEFNLYRQADVDILKSAIIENLNKYMTDEWRDFKTSQNGWPVLTASIWQQQSGIKIMIYYHQNDIQYESQRLCDILLRKVKDEE